MRRIDFIRPAGEILRQLAKSEQRIAKQLENELPPFSNGLMQAEYI